MVLLLHPFIQCMDVLVSPSLDFHKLNWYTTFMTRTLYFEIENSSFTLLIVNNTLTCNFWWWWWWLINITTSLCSIGLNIGWESCTCSQNFNKSSSSFLSSMLLLNCVIVSSLELFSSKTLQLSKRHLLLMVSSWLVGSILVVVNKFSD